MGEGIAPVPERFSTLPIEIYALDALSCSWTAVLTLSRARGRGVQPKEAPKDTPTVVVVAQTALDCTLYAIPGPPSAPLFLLPRFSSPAISLPYLGFLLPVTALFQSFALPRSHFRQ
eukprot:256640-Rhodomonas_salina.2